MAEKLAKVDNDTIVVDQYDLDFDDIVELHSIMFWTLLDFVLVKLKDDRCSCL